MTAEKTFLKCSHCSKEFKYDSERKRHEQSHSPQFQCKICSKNFSFISALRRHEKQHERTGNVTCNECGREFRDQILLRRHTKYAHGGSFTCTKCDTTFSSEPALRTHMQSHKAESERRYQCSFEGCGKKFNFAHHLKHHELTHTNSKQHFCKICGKGFIQSHHLKTHLKTHSGDSSLYCTYRDCNKKFATEYVKKRHIAKYHTKADSGISSDSNSTYDMSISNITMKETTVAENGELIQLEAEDLSIANRECETNSLEYDYKDIDEVTNCKLALGSCIMRAEGEKCVCAEITKTVETDYDFTPIEGENINLNSLSITDCNASACCGGNCNNNNDLKDDLPEIEYKTDGTVKIKEFSDLDIMEIGQKSDRNVILKSDMKFIPYNSCKAVLGNCIVSGNGTIGDGCLCAKMIADDQVTAQEIEDITPLPNAFRSVI